MKAWGRSSLYSSVQGNSNSVFGNQCFEPESGAGHRIFSAIVVPNRPMLLGPATYVLGSLQIAHKEEMT